MIIGRPAARPLAVGAVLALLLAGCSPATPGPVTSAAPSATAPVAAPPAAPMTTQVTTPMATPAADPGPGATAAVLLDALPVRGRAPRTGYERDRFGEAWTDDVTVSGGHNGCDTRSDVLRRDLREVVLKPDSRGCVPLTGTLDDPYTGHTKAFVRGRDTSDDVQIDHVVALSNAWQTGAQQLTDAQRRDLAGDPLNLQAVDGPTNQRKGAGDAATWLPPARTHRCDYVARQVAVKAKYRLWVTEPEQAAIRRVLLDCPGHAVPTDEGTAVPAPARP